MSVNLQELTMGKMCFHVCHSVYKAWLMT